MLAKIMKEKVESLRNSISPVIYDHSLSDAAKFDRIII